MDSTTCVEGQCHGTACAEFSERLFVSGLCAGVGVGRSLRVQLQQQLHGRGASAGLHLLLAAKTEHKGGGCTWALRRH